MVLPDLMHVLPRALYYQHLHSSISQMYHFPMLLSGSLESLIEFYVEPLTFVVANR